MRLVHSYVWVGLLTGLTAIAACDRDSQRAPPKPPVVAPATANSVQDKVIGILSKQLGVRGAEIRRGLRLREDLKADDLDQVELVMALEDAFNLNIPDEAALRWRTVGDVVGYIERAAPR